MSLKKALNKIAKGGPITQNPNGACCFRNGECKLMSGKKECEKKEGTWIGGNCTPNPCKMPVGACCKSLNGQFVECENLTYDRCREWCDDHRDNTSILWHEYSTCTPGDFDYCIVSTHTPGGELRTCTS